MENPNPSSAKLVGALTNGIAILRYLQHTRAPVGVTQVAHDLKINPSTCFNLLRTLVHERLVNFDSRTRMYTLSLAIVSFARGALDQEQLGSLLHPELQRIARAYGVAMNLWRRIENNRVLLIDRAEPDMTVQISMRVGQRLPLLVGALGRCFAAFGGMRESELRERFAKMRLADPKPYAEWKQEVEKVRQDGYAVDRGQFAAGVTTVSVPIFDHRENLPIAAVSAICIAAQIDEAAIEELAEEMLQLSSLATHAAQ